LKQKTHLLLLLVAFGKTLPEAIIVGFGCLLLAAGDMAGSIEMVIGLRPIGSPMNS